ncbi:MAG: type III-A CRISPR-associated RAMP protein Csm3 [Candidatus Viridilinea halotolerans]|uniref:CRISPR system Cms endoribonuclease Csm3 n=1 Tax=Candidatus Viridilinea halotolerans TaxID=2491704 RepID=A0A426TWB4_9CHLR|nr:MAG: type III-A CRISPR-associated RAMP protein Csm3 [Candidatus Viridilinea halotolerans]
MSERVVNLYGRIFLRTELEMVTGLHIGGAAAGLEIGGVDKPVIRNARTNQPYIPGSSLKGKLRSLMEKAYGAPQTFSVNRDVFVHLPESEEQYARYQMIGGIFGTLPERKGFRVSSPTRLAVRDVQLEPNSAAELKLMRADLPFTEIKWEAAIDRVTSAAAPRQIERVPAGAVFGPAELVFSVYVGADEQPTEVAQLFAYVVEALGHLQDDYLGGMGSRGNGQVRLRNLALFAKLVGADGAYGDKKAYVQESLTDLAALDRAQLKQWLINTFK